MCLPSWGWKWEGAAAWWQLRAHGCWAPTSQQDGHPGIPSMNTLQQVTGLLFGDLQGQRPGHPLSGAELCSPTRGSSSGFRVNTAEGRLPVKDALLPTGWGCSSLTFVFFNQLLSKPAQDRSGMTESLNSVGYYNYN